MSWITPTPQLSAETLLLMLRLLQSRHEGIVWELVLKDIKVTNTAASIKRTPRIVADVYENSFCLSR